MSFNRRPNRIAGPGFNINVRYDDQHMYRARSSNNSASSEVAKGVTVENFDVKEAELLVANKAATMYHDGYTHCFSSANGFPESTGASAADVEEDILSKVRFIGVAVTEYKPSKAYSEQGFVAQVGGVVTLINEGRDIIKPGDKVELGLNLQSKRRITRDKGIPRDKIRFCIQKAKSKNQLIKEAATASGGSVAKNKTQAEQALTQAEGMTEGTPQEKKDKKAAIKKAKADLQKCSSGECTFKTDDLADFLDTYEQLNSRVIGKAYSYAKPGDRLEVGLQPRNPY